MQQGGQRGTDGDGQRRHLKRAQPSGRSGSLEHQLLPTFTVLTPVLKFSQLPSVLLYFFFTNLLVFRGPGPHRQLLTGRKNSLWTGSRRRSLTDLPFKLASPQPPADSLHTLIQLGVFILYPQGNWNPLASPQISSLWPDGQRCHPSKEASDAGSCCSCGAPRWRTPPWRLYE